MLARSAMVCTSEGHCSRPKAPSRSDPMPQWRALPGELADVIDVVGDGLERDAGTLGRRRAADPAGDEHPGVERRADDRAARDELPELFVGELALVRHQRPAVRVARPHRPAKMIHGVAEAVVAQVRGVEDHPEALHLARAAPGPRAPRSPVALVPLRVDAGTVMRRADGAQTLRVGALEVRQRHDRVGAFEAQDVADRQVIRLEPAASVRDDGRAPRGPRSARSRRAPPSPGTRRAAPASSPRPAPGECQPGEPVVRRDIPRNLGRHAQPDAAAPHLGERDRSPPRSGFRSAPARARESRRPGARDRGSTRSRSSRGRGARRQSA